MEDEKKLPSQTWHLTATVDYDILYHRLNGPLAQLAEQLTLNQ